MKKLTTVELIELSEIGAAHIVRFVDKNGMWCWLTARGKVGVTVYMQQEDEFVIVPDVTPMGYFNSHPRCHDVEVFNIFDEDRVWHSKQKQSYKKKALG